MTETPRIAFDKTPRPGTEDNEHPEWLPATRGFFSEPYFDQMRRALEMAPDLIEHVVSMVTVKVAGDSDVQGSKEPPLPFNATAFDDANGIYMQLAYSTDMWAKEMNRQAPKPVLRAWKNEYGQVIGLPNETAPDAARKAAQAMSSWLVLNLEDICWRHGPWVVEMHDELETIFTVAAKWPKEMKPHYSPMPCPSDGGIVAIFPAAVFGDEETYACERCGRPFAPDEYKAYVHAYLKSRETVGTREAKTQLMLSERIRTQLLAKYGGTTRQKGA